MQKLEKLVLDLKYLAQKYNIIIFTATQPGNDYSISRSDRSSDDPDVIIIDYIDIITNPKQEDL